MLGAFALAGDALACTCAQASSLERRLEAADAAFVGRLVSVRGTAYRFEVDQVVKGSLDEALTVQSASTTAQCGLRRSRRDEAVGVLLMRAGEGRWASSLCAQTTAGELLSIGGEPPGQALKLLVGVIVLLGVLAYALHRLRRRRAVEAV